MKANSSKAWAVMLEGKLLLVDGRCPIFWRRHVARDFIEKHGVVNARIERVVVSPAKSGSE